jgi:hypothetical protein
VLAYARAVVPARLSATLPLLLVAGCSGLGPVARPPWVEDRSLELHREVLTVAVDRAGATVEARLELRGSGAARELAFPIGGATSASGFAALVVRRGEPPRVIEARRGEASILPVGEASESWDIAVPEHALGAEHTELVVRYHQPALESFRYVLLSGAYWAGSIRAFFAQVEDPGRRVTRAELDGAPPHRRSLATLSWALEDYEPRDALELELR